MVPLNKLFVYVMNYAMFSIHLRKQDLLLSLVLSKAKAVLLKKPIKGVNFRDSADFAVKKNKTTADSN
jgi:hypothetical protein